MTINGVNRDIDFTDADLLEKIEEGSKKVYDETEKIRNVNLKIAEGIRQECKILKDFIDYVFGEGTSKEWFGEKDSLHLILQAFTDIINERDKQMNSINELASKYSPERVQR